MQTTIQHAMKCSGIGIHAGTKTQMTLKPAPSDTGVLFIRTDVTSADNKILASYENVSDTRLSTTIRNAAMVHVSTIEHLMAAVWGCGINNLIVEIDGPEVPIMEGSSKPFVLMLERADRQILNAPARYLKLLKKIHVQDQEAEILAIPAAFFSVDLTIDFAHPVIGKQRYIFTPEKNFNAELANARTFGFIHELAYLKKKGLARGASLDNAIGLDEKCILNADGLRYDDEFVRHKLLDLLGDLFCAGGEILGNIKGRKTSHRLNNEFLRQLFNDPTAYEWVDEPNS